MADPRTDAKIADLEQQILTAPSPTGTPLLPQSIARWATVCVVTALAVLGALAACYPDSQEIRVALAVTTAIGAVLGIASPGLRRGVVPVLLVAALATSGCAWLTRARPALAECGSSALAGAVDAALPDVAIALAGGEADWQGALDGVVARLGQAALCALAALVDALEGGAGGSEVAYGEAVARAELAARGRLALARYGAR